MGKLSAPFAEIIARLDYHTAREQVPARRLASWDWKAEPVQEIVGMRDFPWLRIFMPIGAEIFTPSNLGNATMTLEMGLCSDKKRGLVEHLRDIERLTDALRTRIDASAAVTNPDPYLLGTVKTPWEWRIAASNVLDIAFSSRLTLAVETKPYILGNSA